MTIGTNDAVVKLGTTKALEASGATFANNTMSASATSSYSIATDGASAPDAEFVLSVTFATAPTINTTIDMYAQELSVDGTNNAQAPTSNYKPRYITSFVVNAVTTAQFIKSNVYDVPESANYFLFNNGTGQAVSAGWTLKVTPRTIGPSP